MSHILTPDIEAQTLALLTMEIMGCNQAPFTTVAFEYALPLAYRCLELTKEFLEKKEAEAEAEAEAYWSSEAGQKRREELKARFEDMAKRKKG